MTAEQDNNTKHSSTRATQGYVDTQAVSLKEYFDMRINTLCKLIENAEKAHDEHAREVQKNIDERFDAQEKSVEVALEANNKRLDGMNEFRQALIDREKITVSKIEFEALEKSVENKFDNVKEKIDSLELSRAEMAGKASQSQIIVAYIFSGISALIGIIGLIVAILDRLSKT